MHGDHPDHGGGERAGNLRIAHVGDVLLTAHFEVVDLGMEGFADFARRAGEVDHHAVGVNGIDGEAVRPKPACDGVDVLLRHTVLLSLFCRHDPVVEIGRALVGEAVDVLVELPLQLGRPLQLQQHVFHGEAVFHAAAVVFGVGFPPRAPDPDQLAFVDGLGDEDGLALAPSPTPHSWDALVCENQRQAGQGQGAEPRLPSHGLLIP